MNKKQHSILDTLAKLPLVLLYVCVFLAQSTHNYDISNLTNAFLINVSHQNEAKGFKESHLKQSIGDCHSRKVNIRLNKSFEPKSFDISPVVSLEGPTWFILPKVSFSYPNPFIPASHLAVSPLRGPPTVV